MSQKETGFDAFFSAITTSPEFKSAVTKDWKWDSMEALEASLMNMQAWVEKASGIMKSFDTKFQNPLWKEGGSLKWNGSETGDFVSGKSEQNPQSRVTRDSSFIKGASVQPKTGNAKDEPEIPALEVQHFVKKDETTWGFAWVAGMENLKQELRDSFIKPLRFKFMIERLKQKSHPELDSGSSLPGNIEDSESSSEWRQNNTLLLRLYAEYEKFRISIPTGMLFYGPPGTGKTFITRKLAEELGCGFISKNMGEFGSSYLHQTTKNIKDFFAWAKKAAENEPIILFLDEIDSLVSARTNNVDANKAEEISQFLQEFNALEDAPNLIVIAATNRPDHLDPAILRSGRLDKKIYLWPPDDIARRALFEMYIEKKWRPHEVLDYDELMNLTAWYVSADIEAICDEVARDASQNLLELIDEAESWSLTDKDLDGHTITMDSLRKTIAETLSSLKMVDMSVYGSWLEKIK